MAEPRDPLDELDAGLARLDEAGLRRRRRIVTTSCRPELQLADRAAPVVAFCSNDYLGLAAEPTLASAAAGAAARWGVGAGASHLVSGHYAAHEALEARLSALCGEVADGVRRLVPADRIEALYDAGLPAVPSGT